VRIVPTLPPVTTIAIEIEEVLSKFNWIRIYAKTKNTKKSIHHNHTHQRARSNKKNEKSLTEQLLQPAHMALLVHVKGSIVDIGQNLSQARTRRKSVSHDPPNKKKSSLTAKASIFPSPVLSHQA